MYIDSITSALSSAATAGWQFLNSNIVIAFVGGFTGAIGGALGAQRIVERSRKRQERLKELRYTNAAIMVAHTICNAALALKKQHVQPMRENFLKLKADLEAFKAKRDAGQIATNVEYHLQIDMRTYPAPIVPIETLKHVVFQELSAVGRPLALVAVIEQSLIGLSSAIAKRDQLIQKLATAEIPKNKQYQYYFGLPFEGGNINQEYPDLVEAIYSYADDLAFFSYQLCNDLMKHGVKVRNQWGQTELTRVSRTLLIVDNTRGGDHGKRDPEGKRRPSTAALQQGIQACSRQVAASRTKACDTHCA